MREQTTKGMTGGNRIKQSLLVSNFVGFSLFQIATAVVVLCKIVYSLHMLFNFACFCCLLICIKIKQFANGPDLDPSHLTHCMINSVPENILEKDQHQQMTKA